MADDLKTPEHERVTNLPIISTLAPPNLQQFTYQMQVFNDVALNI